MEGEWDDGHVPVQSSEFRNRGKYNGGGGGGGGGGRQPQNRQRNSGFSNNFGGSNNWRSESSGGGGGGGGGYNANVNSVNIEVPSKYVGRIIGKGGSKISNLQFESGAKINVTKEIVGDNTVIKISGASEEIEKAKEMIEELTVERQPMY